MAQLLPPMDFPIPIDRRFTNPNAPMNWQRIPLYRMVLIPKPDEPPYARDLFNEGAFLDGPVTELIVTAIRRDGYEKAKEAEIDERQWPAVASTCLHEAGCIHIQRSLLWLCYTKWINMEINPPAVPDPKKPFYDIRSGMMKCECSSIHRGQWFATRCYAREKGEHVVGWALWSKDERKFVADPYVES